MCQTYHAKKKNPVTSAGFLEAKESAETTESLAILHIEANPLIISASHKFFWKPNLNLHRDTVKQECLLYTSKNTSNVVQENSQLPRAMTRSYDNFCASLLTQAVMLPRHRKPRPCKPGIQQHAFWGSRSSTGRKAAHGRPQAWQETRISMRAAWHKFS